MTKEQPGQTLQRPWLRRTAAVLVLSLFGSWASPAAAAQAPPAPPAAQAQPAAQTGSGQAQPASPDLNFDLLDSGADAKKPTAAESALEQARRDKVDRAVKIRRGMLLSHQAIGFATLAALAATLVIGQLNYQDKYVSGAYSGSYENTHLGLSIATTGLFAATGALALFAPNPYPKPYRMDSAMVHRVTMALATAGMVTQMILGPIIVSRAGKQDQGALALGHLVTGYATFGFMAAGVLSYVF